jgi:hypothetical protein
VRALSTEPGFPGTAEQVIAQAAQYRRAGVDELALSFAGPQPTADAAYFARAVKRLIPDGELAIDSRPATAALSRTIATARRCRPAGRGSTRSVRPPIGRTARDCGRPSLRDGSAYRAAAR